jgi:hypothetical protein
MLLNHLKNLPTFSGNQNEDVIRWLKDIIDRLNYAKFTDDQKIMIISGYLNGDTRRWLLRNMPVVDTWPTFIQELKKEFTSTLLAEDDVCQLNHTVYVLDETMIHYDNDMNDKQKCELLEEKQANLDDSDITLVELNDVVSLNMCIVESGKNNLETIWPDESDSWFIRVQLPQRRQFI